MTTDHSNNTDEANPCLSVVGDTIALGPLRRDLVPLYQRWVNDPEVSRTLGLTFRMMTREAEDAWYDSVAKDDRGVHFTIYELATLRPIGNTALAQVDHANRTATFGLVIGEKGCWGKGYGTEATRLVLDYGFTLLGLHNILLTVFSFNERGIRAYRRAGFQEIGRRREARWLAGRAYDVIYMDSLAGDFESPVLRQLVAPTDE